MGFDKMLQYIKNHWKQLGGAVLAGALLYPGYKAGSAIGNLVWGPDKEVREFVEQEYIVPQEIVDGRQRESTFNFDYDFKLHPRVRNLKGLIELSTRNERQRAGILYLIDGADGTLDGKLTGEGLDRFETSEYEALVGQFKERYGFLPEALEGLGSGKVSITLTPRATSSTP